MKTRIIDYLLKDLETKADAIGYDIDNDERYQQICALLADIDVYHYYIPSYAEKVETDKNLKALYKQLGLSYGDVFKPTAVQYFALIGKQSNKVYDEDMLIAYDKYYIDRISAGKRPVNFRRWFAGEDR